MSAWNYSTSVNPGPTDIRSRTSLASLIISEDGTLRNALADAIASEGAQAVATDTIDDAIIRLEHGVYPLIFAPQQLHGASGSELCARLRATHGGEYAWIIALPRYEISLQRQLVTSGFDGVLKAPFEPTDIALLIAGAARNARTGEQLNVARERAGTLHDLVRDLTDSCTSDTAAEHLLEAATAVLPQAGGAVWLKERGGSSLECVKTFGLSEQYGEAGSEVFAYFSDERWLELARQSLFVNALSDAPRSFTDVARSEGFAASLTIALLSPTQIIGALVLFVREQTPPEAHAIELLETFAASASLVFDRVGAQQQIAAMSSMIEHMSDGIFVQDIDGSFLMVNSALEAITGYSRRQLETLQIFDLLEGGRDGEAGVEVQRQLRVIAESEDSSDHRAVSQSSPLLNLMRPDQRVVQAELHLHPLRTDDHRSRVLVQGIIHDITARERIRREFDALRVTSAAMANAADLEEAIGAVVVTLRDQAEYADASIWMMSFNGVELVRQGQSATEHKVVALGDGPVGRAASTREPVFLRGMHGQLSVVGQPQHNQIAVPILNRDGVAGVIAVTGRPRKPLDDQDITFLTSLATQIASSIERMNLHHELQRQATIDTITGLENREAFLKRLADAIAGSGNDPVSLLILGVDRFKGVNDTYGHLIADAMLRQVAQTLTTRIREPQTIARYASDQFAILLPNTGRAEAPAIAEEFRIGIATQLFMAAEQVEQMTVSVGAASYPTDADSLDQLLLAASHAMYLAKQAGRNQVYQSNEAFAELAAAHGRITDLLRQAPKETLALLVRAMDQRTPERAGHSQRVADYALALARALGMPESEIAALRIAAVIHDVGMFSLPDSLLRKPSGLSDSERELLYGIPINAHRLLSQLPLPASVLPAVVHQHEHWDGSGFPSGLRGSLIPPGARIIAVADAIDAMTSERAHRQSLSMEEALFALAEQAGQRFDPDVVQAARSLLGELSDVSEDRAGSNLESTLVEALEVIPHTEKVSA
jgi:diguanylate cyclase (GGDEF)-like protein/PAS domain S-box-containing protein